MPHKFLYRFPNTILLFIFVRCQSFKSIIAVIVIAVSETYKFSINGSVREPTILFLIQRNWAVNSPSL